jgi:peroxiredoxin
MAQFQHTDCGREGVRIPTTRKRQIPIYWLNDPAASVQTSSEQRMRTANSEVSLRIPMIHERIAIYPDQIRPANPARAEMCLSRTGFCAHDVISVYTRCPVLRGLTDPRRALGRFVLVPQCRAGDDGVPRTSAGGTVACLSKLRTRLRLCTLSRIPAQYDHAGVCLDARNERYRVCRWRSCSYKLHGARLSAKAIKPGSSPRRGFPVNGFSTPYRVIGQFSRRTRQSSGSGTLFMRDVVVGSRVPNVLNVLLAHIENNKLRTVAVREFLAYGRAALLGVPGAFTPVCTEKHIPDFVRNAEKLMASGYNQLVCIAPNDPFVLKAWSRLLDPEKKLEFLSDGNLDFARALQLKVENCELFLGWRSERYLIMVENGSITRVYSTIPVLELSMHVMSNLSRYRAPASAAICLPPQRWRHNRSIFSPTT